jgi:3-deoxy-D-manno-octulosonic-acid transferase
VNFVYNIALALGFLILSPRFVYDAITKGKYAAGFKQRLGHLPDFNARGRQVVVLHCVSVGETNAALPLAKKLKETSPEMALVVTTTTKTGQHVANEAYKGIADLIVYFPFDFKFAVKRFLKHVAPSVVLLTETELWFNFVRLAYKSDARVVIVNGRLSERSFKRYTWIKGFMKRLLAYVDLALMQTNADATRLMALGIRGSKVKVTGNLKFDHDIAVEESELTRELRARFGMADALPLIIAASTHEPEERYVLEALDGELGKSCRLMLVPRHPERFDSVERLLQKGRYNYTRRTSPPSSTDLTTDVILLDTVGELRSAYPLAEIVFVGGSLMRHGGQSVFEPAAAGKAIVTGPYTANFASVVGELLRVSAIRQTLTAPQEYQIPERLSKEFTELLGDDAKRSELGQNAAAAMLKNRGAVDKTIKYIEPLIKGRR